MIMLESLFITLIGVALGVVLGLGISAIVERHPFDYSRWADEFAAWGVYTTVYPAKATALNVVDNVPADIPACIGSFRFSRPGAR